MRQKFGAVARFVLRLSLMRFKILIADDDAAVRRLVASVLAGRGRGLVEAEDGDAALAAWRGGGLSLLVLDDLMPGCTGSQAAREIRRAGDEVPVILMSGTLNEEIVLLAEALGAVTCLAKPFGVAELRGLADRALGKQPGRSLRLGSLALRSGVLSPEQLRRVLDIQSHEADRGAPARRVGQLCVLEGFLSKEQVESLLREQETLRGGSD